MLFTVKLSILHRVITVTQYHVRTPVSCTILQRAINSTARVIIVQHVITGTAMMCGLFYNTAH